MRERYSLIQFSDVLIGREQEDHAKGIIVSHGTNFLS